MELKKRKLTQAEKKTKNRLTILGQSVSKKNYFVVKCTCGTIKEVRKDHIKNGETLSCGCLQIESLLKRSITHGHSKTSEYKTWCAVLHRCENETDKRYYDYGGRGIDVCNDWHDFNIFFADMGKKPFKDAQIDRIDNNLGYYKLNCRWVSRTQNQRNMRSNRIITYKGVSKTLVEFAEQFCINKSTLSKRICRSGWSIERAIETPVQKKRKTK